MAHVRNPHPPLSVRGIAGNRAGAQLRFCLARRQGTAHRRSGQALPDGGRGAARRLPRHRRGGDLRAPGPERGGQVDADPLHDRARAADVGIDPCVRPRRDQQLRRRPPGCRAGSAGAEPRLVPDGRGDTRLPRRLLRDAQARTPRAREGTDRDLLARGQANRAHPDPLRRDEAAADPGARPDAQAPPADPRRADRRRRHRAAPRAVALRPAHQRRGDDDPADDALPGGGRPALRQDRLHQRGSDHRQGVERRAGGQLRGREPRGRLSRAGRAQGALALARAVEELAS